MFKLQQISKIRYFNYICLKYSTNAAQASEKIEIPQRIHRGPTDILRALESTVSRDPTAAHYKYIDDPYLIPRSNLGKRTFALSKESGRKAAHWIRAQHADLFQHKDCEPPIEAFFPRMAYDENSQVTEEDLKHVIEEVLVSDAITVYNLLKSSGQEVSTETLLDFLELICFYNADEALSEEFIEERWFLQSSGKEKLRKTWKDGELAEEIFTSLKEPDARAYSAIIMGMIKYYQVDRAWELFNQSQEKKLVLNLEVYNGLIRVANFLKEDYTLRWNFITDILSIINAAGLKPTLRTLNSILEALSEMGSSPANKKNVLKTMKEFQVHNIEPSLASWYFPLITFCKDRASVSGILKDILPHIENKEFTSRDPKDTYFFLTAMDICRNHLHDKTLAERINKLLHHKNNYDLIGDAYKESIYYRHYFMVMIESMELKEFMSNIYDYLVPHIYVPEPLVMGELINQVEIQNQIELLPKLWSDMLIFDHTDRENLINSILNIISNNKPEEGSVLVEQFANIAWSIWCKVEEQHPQRIKRIAFTGEMLGSIMTAVLWNNDFEKAAMVMNKLDKDIHDVAGVPNIEALSLFLDHCIREKAPFRAIQCLQYCNDSGFSETEEMAARLQKELPLNEEAKDKLAKVVGSHVVS